MLFAFPSVCFVCYSRVSDSTFTYISLSEGRRLPSTNSSKPAPLFLAKSLLYIDSNTYIGLRTLFVLYAIILSHT